MHDPREETAVRTLGAGPLPSTGIRGQQFRSAPLFFCAEITGILRGVFLESEASERARHTAFADMPPPVVTLLDGENTFFHVVLLRRLRGEGDATAVTIYW
jgi:hypothetical protein